MKRPHKASKKASGKAARPVTPDGDPGFLRIIAGTLRSRSIEFTTDVRTRPMKDRTREAVFNLLGGKLHGYAAFDLFAGSGILAIESVSRGAEYGVMIEMLAKPAREILANTKRLGIDDRCCVFTADTFAWLGDMPDHLVQLDRRFTPPPGTRWCVFICPPYGLWASHRVPMKELLETWVSAAPDGSLFAIELDEATPIDLLPKAIDWQVRGYRPAVMAIGEKLSLEVVDLVKDP